MGAADTRCAFIRDAALVFPGVGVRLSGREPVLFGEHRRYFAPLFGQASAFCGRDLASALVHGNVDDLSDEDRQCFTYAFSAGAADLLVEGLGVVPKAVAGYSFGIYAALYAARVIPFEEGLRVLHCAFEIMNATAAEGTYGMGIVVGLDADELEAIVASHALTSVLRTNTNHGLCHVFSGTRSEIVDFLTAAEAAGAFKSEPLTVSIPYHHPAVLASAPDALRAHIDPSAWAPPRFPVVSSIDASFLDEVALLVDFVARHLATPIHWEQVMGALDRAGVETVFECGPGISLSQNGRFLPHDMRYINAKKARRCQMV